MAKNPFLWFAVLVALRDVVAEAFKLAKTSPIGFAFVLCALVALLAWAGIFFEVSRDRRAAGASAPSPERATPTPTAKTSSPLAKRLAQAGVLPRCLALGILGAVIYGATFYLVGHPGFGAGLFNMIDYGLGPLLTAFVGRLFFGNRLTGVATVSFGLCCLGIVLLHQASPAATWTLLLIALLSPIATAASDGLSKWLLNEERDGHLTRCELMALRFTPAAVVLFALALWRGEDFGALNYPATLAVGIALAFYPLWLLYSALGRSDLPQLAASEFLIPVISFLGTLHLHPDQLAVLPIFGAVLVGMGYVLYEVAGKRRLRDVFSPRSEASLKTSDDGP